VISKAVCYSWISSLDPESGCPGVGCALFSPFPLDKCSYVVEQVTNLLLRRSLFVIYSYLPAIWRCMFKYRLTKEGTNNKSPHSKHEVITLWSLPIRSRLCNIVLIFVASSKHSTKSRVFQPECRCARILQAASISEKKKIAFAERQKKWTVWYFLRCGVDEIWEILHTGFPDIMWASATGISPVGLQWRALGVVSSEETCKGRELW
jgi:hypothetical protein